MLTFFSEHSSIAGGDPKSFFKGSERSKNRDMLGMERLRFLHIRCYPGNEGCRFKLGPRLESVGVDRAEPQITHATLSLFDLKRLVADNGLEVILKS